MWVGIRTPYLPYDSSTLQRLRYLAPLYISINSMHWLDFAKCLFKRKWLPVLNVNHIRTRLIVVVNVVPFCVWTRENVSIWDRGGGGGAAQHFYIQLFKLLLFFCLDLFTGGLHRGAAGKTSQVEGESFKGKGKSIYSSFPTSAASPNC